MTFSLLVGIMAAWVLRRFNVADVVMNGIPNRRTNYLKNAQINLVARLIGTGRRLKIRGLAGRNVYNIRLESYKNKGIRRF